VLLLSVANGQQRRRKRRSSERRNSLGVGVVMGTLTLVNVYVFFIRDDTSVLTLMQSSSMAQAAGDSAVDAGRAVTLAVAVKQTADASRATWHRPSGGRHTDKSTVKEGTIRDHDTLAGVIEREGLGPASQPVLRALSRLHDPKSLRAGDRYVVSFNSEGKPIAFEYLPSAILRYVVTENTNGSWSGREERKLLAWKPVVVTGRIESSLFESVRRAGERAALAEQMIDVFAWDINFYADQHPGDRWRVLIEKQHIDNRFYRYGNL
jgi:hypothetical protein